MIIETTAMRSFVETAARIMARHYQHQASILHAWGAEWLRTGEQQSAKGCQVIAAAYYAKARELVESL